MRLTYDDYREIMSVKPLGALVINATNRCNLACKYCFTTQNPRDMDVPTALQAIRFGLQHKGNDSNLKVAWFGGEPLLKFKDLIKPVMEECKRLNYNVDWSITTNLTLLTKEVLDFFEEYNVGILCSIDGPAAIQDSNRVQHNGKGSWELIAKNFEDILSYPRVNTFRSTVTPESAVQLFESYKFAKECGMKMWFPGPDYSNKGWTEEVLMKLEEELFYITMDIYNDIANDRIPVDVGPILSSIASFYEEECGRVYELTEKDICFNCGMGTGSIGVSTEGKLFACQEHSTYKNPNDPFLIGDIWKGIDEARHIEFLNQVLTDIENNTLKKENDKKCQECMGIRFCQSRVCVAEGKRITGNYGYLGDFWCWWTNTILVMGQLFLLRVIQEENDKVQKWIINLVKHQFDLREGG